MHKALVCPALFLLGTFFPPPFPMLCFWDAVRARGPSFLPALHSRAGLAPAVLRAGGQWPHVPAGCLRCPQPAWHTGAHVAATSCPMARAWGVSAVSPRVTGMGGLSLVSTCPHHGVSAAVSRGVMSAGRLSYIPSHHNCWGGGLNCVPLCHKWGSLLCVPPLSRVCWISIPTRCGELSSQITARHHRRGSAALPPCVSRA